MAASIELIERMAEVSAADVADDGNAQGDGFRAPAIAPSVAAARIGENRV
jgi:hypothetical protein